jgi:tRNA U55 pseudouridine synthase TruB
MRPRGDPPLTYRQVDELVRRAVQDVVQPLQRDIADMRAKVEEIQRTAVSQAALDKYALKGVSDTQHDAIEERMRNMESAVKDLQKDESSKAQQGISLLTTAGIAIFALLAGGYITLLINLLK